MSVVKVDKVVTAQGKVVARAATIVVQPLETAIVRSIEVHEGESGSGRPNSGAARSDLRRGRS